MSERNKVQHLQYQNRVADWNRLREQLRDAPRTEADDKQQLKAQAMAAFEAALDEKLRYLRHGQAIGLRFRLEVVNEDWSFRSEPTARNSPQYAEWREDVYQRDGFRCVECGAGSELHAHHIKSWRRHHELRFDVDNGQTLCVKCHQNKHPNMHLVTRPKKNKPDGG